MWGAQVTTLTGDVMRDIDELFEALQRSKFRSRFKLSPAERKYTLARSPAELRKHARSFVEQRLAPAEPEKDGRQTPMRGHPVFIAQHATATCCRGCLAKWHDIEAGRPLTPLEVDHLVDVIGYWIELQLPQRDAPQPDPQRRLFDD